MTSTSSYSNRARKSRVLQPEQAEQIVDTHYANGLPLFSGTVSEGLMRLIRKAAKRRALVLAPFRAADRRLALLPNEELFALGPIASSVKLNRAGGRGNATEFFRFVPSDSRLGIEYNRLDSVQTKGHLDGFRAQADAGATNQYVLSGAEANNYLLPGEVDAIARISDQSESDQSG